MTGPSKNASTVPSTNRIPLYIFIVLNFFGVDTLEPREWVEAAAAPTSPVEDPADLPFTAAQLMEGHDEAVLNTRMYMQDNTDPLGINDTAYT